MSDFSIIMNDVIIVMMYYFEFLSIDMFEEWKRLECVDDVVDDGVDDGVDDVVDDVVDTCEWSLILKAISDANI